MFDEALLGHALLDPSLLALASGGLILDDQPHELDAPPWRRVETTLMATALLIRDAYDLRLAPLSLNLTQATILSYVGEFGPATQTTIAGHLSHGRAATGAAIDQLQRRGLVARHADPADRRVWRVDLTPAGRELLPEVSRIDQVLRTELRAGITRPERHALALVMQRLQSNLHSAIARGTPSVSTSPA